MPWVNTRLGALLRQDVAHRLRVPREAPSEVGFINQVPRACPWYSIVVKASHCYNQESMRIVFTKHALAKFTILQQYGWHFTKQNIRQTIRQPRWRGTSRFGQQTAMALIDDNHIVRVISYVKRDMIKIITFHPARRGTYESTL